MISICIPVYNAVVTDLVKALTLQCNEQNIPFEIVLIDDYSSDYIRLANHEVCSNHKYVLLDKNIGRSKIRNLFTQYARYDLLLFLDSDSSVISGNFIKTYLKALSPEKPVIYGGRIYRPGRPERLYRLRWIYSKKRECFTAGQRTKNQYRFFKTNNFIIDRSVLEAIRFDERLSGYGHEDTLFAYLLMKNRYSVKHTNNPVVHYSQESNKEFIIKTEAGLVNLARAIEFPEYDRDIIKNIKLLRVAYFIEKFRAGAVIDLFFSLLYPCIKFFLLKGYFYLWMFDFYKLGVFRKTGVKLIGR